MRTLLSAACGLLLTTTALAQTEVISPATPTTIKPPRLLHFRVGLGTGLQALRPSAGGTTRLGLTNGLSGIVAIGNRYEVETGVLLTMMPHHGERRHHGQPGDCPSTAPTTQPEERHHGGGKGGGLLVPVKLNVFVWEAGPLRAYMSGGLLTTLHGGGKCGNDHDADDVTTTTATTTSETTTTTTPTQRVALAATAGVGLEYRPCTGPLSVRIEPQGRVDLQSVNRTWGGGLRLGAFWSF